MTGATLEINFTKDKQKKFVANTQPQMKSYSYEEAKEKSVAYFDGDELAAEVWINKYALKDHQGNIYELTPSDMHRRISIEIARIEQNYPYPLP